MGITSRRIFLVAGLLLVAIGIFSANRFGVFASKESANTSPAETPRVKPAPIDAKGVYLTSVSAADPKKRAEIIKLLDETPLNAVVIDIKDYTGYIAFAPRKDAAFTIWEYKDLLKDPKAIIKDFHDHGVYVIARQTVFQDPALTKVRPDLAVKHANGGIWRDKNGLAWGDPTKKEIWEYNAIIAKEAIKLGFDEIQFDYVRFPSDGDMKAVRYSRAVPSRAAVMREYYKYMSEQLSNEPAYISVDFFGLTLDNNKFDLNIGQRLTDGLEFFDYVSPMVYPSHYPSGYLKLENPAAHPYQVIANGMKIAEKNVSASTSTPRGKIRPWLQAFNIGATYDAAKIRAQVKATEESKLSSGWLLWNARNVYSPAQIKEALK